MTLLFLQALLCLGLYPNFAIADERNAWRSDAEHLYHTSRGYIFIYIYIYVYIYYTSLFCLHSALRVRATSNLRACSALIYIYIHIYIYMYILCPSFFFTFCAAFFLSACGTPCGCGGRVSPSAQASVPNLDRIYCGAGRVRAAIGGRDLEFIAAGDT